MIVQKNYVIWIWYWIGHCNIISLYTYLSFPLLHSRLCSRYFFIVIMLERPFLILYHCRWLLIYITQKEMKVYSFFLDQLVSDLVLMCFEIDLCLKLLQDYYFHTNLYISLQNVNFLHNSMKYTVRMYCKKRKYVR